MKRDFWKAVKLMLAQLLELNINEQLIRENEYLREENQVLCGRLKQSGKRLFFSNDQRKVLAIKGKALGQRIYEVVSIVRPITILNWHRKLVAKKFDSSKVSRKPGRPKTDQEIEQLIAKENKTWCRLQNGFRNDY